MSRLLARVYHWLSWRSGHAMREIRRLRRPRVLTYHAIGPQDTPQEQFDWQLRMVRDEFEVVAVPELVGRLPAPYQSAAMTFSLELAQR